MHASGTGQDPAQVLFCMFCCRIPMSSAGSCEGSCIRRLAKKAFCRLLARHWSRSSAQASLQGPGRSRLLVPPLDPAAVRVQEAGPGIQRIESRGQWLWSSVPAPRVDSGSRFFFRPRITPDPLVRLLFGFQVLQLRARNQGLQGLINAYREVV